METYDYKKAHILNEYFSTVGEKLASDLPVCEQVTNKTYFNRVTPCIMNISISHASVTESIEKMKANKACGPDNVSPKKCFLKYAGKDLIPSLLSQVSISAERNSRSVPTSWKTVSALFKKDDETDEENYRPISLLCVPGKLMVHAVATTIATHISEHNLGPPHQWAYKKKPLN